MTEAVVAGGGGKGLVSSSRGEWDGGTLSGFMI